MHHLMEGCAGRAGVDHAHRVRDVVDDPYFPAIGAHGDAHRIDSDIDANHDRASSGADYIQRVRRRVDHIDIATAVGDGVRVGAREGGVPHIFADGELHAGIGVRRASRDERSDEPQQTATDGRKKPSACGLVAGDRHHEAKP